MRSLGGSFATQKNLAHARPMISAIFHFGGAIGDAYISDREITIGGNTYKGAFAQFGEFVSSQVFRDGTFQSREIALSLINFPLVGTPEKRFTDLWSEAAIHAVECDVYLNMREFGAANIYQELLFKAVCRPGAYNPWRCQLRLKSVQEKYLDLKEVSRPIEHQKFPLADLDDVGKRMNINYGGVKNVRCHAIVAGLQFVLQAAMSAVSSVIEIGEDAYNALPSTGIVQIGDEQIAYTGKTSSPSYRLTGLTRGTNSTPIQSHSKDDTVVQVLTEYVYLVGGHSHKAITNPRIVRGDRAYPLTGYSVELANTTRDPDGTLAIIKVPTPPVIKELPVVEISSSQAIQDGIAVQDTIGVQDTISVIDNIGVIDQIGVNDGIGVSDTIGISQANNETKWTQSGTDQTLITGNIPTGQEFSLGLLSFPGQDRALSSGNFEKSVTASIVGATGGPFQILIYSGAPPFGGTQYLVCQGGVGASGAINAIDSQFWGMEARVKNIGGLGSATVTFGAKKSAYNISNIVAKTGSASKTGSATKTGSTFKQGAASKGGAAAKLGAATKTGTVLLTGAVTLSSTSTAEVVLGEYLICDVEGYQDDGGGTWTGTPNSLIENPADVMHHFARVPGAIPPGYVDSAAFVTARGDAPSSHKLAVSISERTNLKELLIAMGMQSRIRCDWPIDKLTAQFLKTSYGAAVKTITQEEVAEDNGETTLEMRYEDVSELLNIVTVYYGRDWTESRSADSFAKLYRIKDAASIAAYGEREDKERFLFDFVAASNDAMAQDLASFYLARHKRPPRVLSAQTFLDQFELLPGDVIAVSFKTALFLASATFAPSAFEIQFDVAGRGIAAARSPQIFDNLNGSQKFLVEEFGLRPGNLRDRRGTRTLLVAREVT